MVVIRRILIIFSFLILLAGLTLDDTPVFPESERPQIMMTILCGNNPYDTRLKPSWGFSCLIESKGKTILFDTGGDGKTVLDNMRILNKDPKAIEIIILSHIHGDHTRGLESLLGEKSNSRIYVPESFPEDFDRAVKDYRAKVVRVNAPIEICQGFRLTGEMGHGIKEQSLIINTQDGIVLVTGCAHPGIIEVIKKAKTIGRENIYMVIGGWHLCSTSEREIKGIIDAFLRMGIQKVAPCHCTGDLTIAMFKKAYGKNFIQAGVGRIIQLEGPR
jgi:7,8-dihydropterin-6-yl-methyl-4-(beta-D-ribofuranosyl)aminobenzene 5'-phosphate synthase